MFRWYGDAEVCYAFLSDVEDDEVPWTWSSTFRTSRWFTRGWTLQELIAPGVVYFYSAGWKEIGSRDTLLNLVVSITKISPDYFETGDLSQFSAAQKMSWAANRETTRPEDKAYCLLGLFDINLPLLYGEGDRAFQRLQEEILLQTEDDSLFAHNHQDVLASSPWYFRHCRGVSLRQAWPYNNNKLLGDGRNVSVKRSRIVMSFWYIEVENSAKLQEFCSVSWPMERTPTSCVVVLLACGTSESAAALILCRDSSGQFVKLAFPTTTVVRAMWKPKLASQLAVKTFTIMRGNAARTRGAWDWRAGNQAVYFGNALRDQMRTDLDGALPSPVMKPIVRPNSRNDSARALVMSQDMLRDKVVLKGPCRSTSGFQLEYVYVAGFRPTWLEREDEVHLIPSESGNQGQPCAVYSSPEGESFLVTLRPTRASVNANLYTNIPPWKGRETLEFMEMLESQRKKQNSRSVSHKAFQRIGSGKEVAVHLEHRRLRNGWWVYLSVTHLPENS